MLIVRSLSLIGLSFQSRSGLPLARAARIRCMSISRCFL